VRETIAWMLLGAGGVVEVLAVAGVVLMRDALDRLHYVGPSGVATALIAAAILVRESFSLIGIYALLLTAFVVFTGPVLAHITGQAIARSRRAPE
jgi:multisubunit Na+/H+ antiporter MnhG subunit